MPMMPFETLFSAKEKKIVLHTRRRTQYHGIMQEFDDNGNFNISRAEEATEDSLEKIGNVIINGNNIAWIDILQ